MTTITSAVFVCSNTDHQKCPDTQLPEFAFIGRSNVGKSSLINTLVSNKKLAKTSGTPGKTQLINHFLINESWHLVDLPGYGYAKISQTQRRKWETMINDYLTQREQLISTFILIDSRLEPQEIDVEFINRLGEMGLPFAIIFTKADKLTKNELNKSMNRYTEKLLGWWEELPPIFISSAENSMGKDEILNYISELVDKSTEF